MSIPTMPAGALVKPGAATAASLGIPAMSNAATYFIDRHLAEGRQAKTAIECGAERVTYGELAANVNRFGSASRAVLDVRPEERIALLLPDAPAFAYAFFGAIKIGAVPVPMDTRWKPHEYRHALNDSRARVLVVSRTLLPAIAAIPREDLPWLRHTVVVEVRDDDVRRAAAPQDSGMTGAAASAGRFEDLLKQGEPHLTAAPTSRDDTAFWLYTSGSTGLPKACVHLHHDMQVASELFARGVLGMTASDRCFSMAKLSFAYGLGNALYFPLAVGGTSILWPGAPTAADAFTVLARHRPTLFFWVPSGYRMMLDYQRPGTEDADLSSVRQAISAGEPLPVSIYEAFHARFGLGILDGIGTTEVLQTFISNRPNATRPGSSGLVVPGYDVRILDQDGNAVRPGQQGDLLVNGDSTCSHYWNQHDLTRNAITGHWIRTGDRYSQDSDGFFWFVGRSDDMFKVRGQWVSPHEVEEALLAHPQVRECAVVGRVDDDGLTKPLAFVVLCAEVAPSAALRKELRRVARHRLMAHKVPAWIAVVDALPRSPTSKLRRFKLREAAFAFASRDLANDEAR